jgi:cell division GTPase FtsZ
MINLLKVGIIGIGNTGNQIASLGKDVLNIPVLAINSSEKDLETISSDIPQKLIKDKEGLCQGAGKDRSLAKKLLKDSIVNILKDEDIITMINDLDVVFIVSSTGGGTGSGTAPIMADLIARTFVDVKVILVGVLPVMNEALGSLVNTLQYLDELYKALPDTTYMLYDNDKLSGLPSYQILQKVNQEVINDINVLRCTYNYQTTFDSIDDRDMSRLLSFPGRLEVCRVENFLEKDCDNKSIEDMIINEFKTNCHVEAQRDKHVVATGVIVNLSDSLLTEFDTNILKVRDFVGVPVHSFNHIYINEDRKQPNRVFYIMNGLRKVKDKIDRISDRIDEINEKQKTGDEENVLGSVDLDSLSNKISDKKNTDEVNAISINDIFSKFE